MMKYGETFQVAKHALNYRCSGDKLSSEQEILSNQGNYTIYEYIRLDISSTETTYRIRQAFRVLLF